MPKTVEVRKSFLTPLSPPYSITTAFFVLLSVLADL